MAVVLFFDVAGVAGIRGGDNAFVRASVVTTPPIDVAGVGRHPGASVAFVPGERRVPPMLTEGVTLVL